MRKLNITDTVLDRLGFSEYWDEDGTWGGRTLTFSNGTKFRIIERDEVDDIYDGYGALSNDEPTYIANHFYFAGFFAIPKKKCYYDLYFLHQMYECIEEEYPECLDEFINKCKEVNMKPYIDEYLIVRKYRNRNKS